MITKKILIAAFALYSLNTMAQAKIGDNPAAVNANSLLELESASKGLLYPRVALTATTNAAPLSAHVQGMTVYNTATAGDVIPGLYVNDGAKWAPLGNGGSGIAQTVTAVCNGFVGNYAPGASERSYTVTFTNNSFSEAQIAPAVGDLIITPASGLTVTSVSPNSATTLSSGATLTVSYTLTGALSGEPDTEITGTFTKLGLSCTSTVIVTVAESVVSGPNGTTLTFMAHDLGADTSLDPHVPVQGIHGNYYQWGRIAPVANAATPPEAIAGWNTTAAPDDSWSDTAKTANDPCPAGYRVPTNSNWRALLNNNVRFRTGTWTDPDPMNFGSAIHFGPDANTKLMTLPANGYRRTQENGIVTNRGSRAWYWSTTQYSGGQTAIAFYSLNNAADMSSQTRLHGFSIRCIKE